MKPIKWIYTALMLLIVWPGRAQETTAYGKSDPDAKAVLDRAAQTYATYKSLKADFTLKTATTDHQLLGSQQGTIWLKGEQFKFQLGDQTVYCDGHTLWTYNKGNKEVQITEYAPKAGQITPSALFTDFYDKNFLYRLNGTSKIKDKTVDVVELTPLDKSQPYYQILAQIDPAQNRLMSMEVFTKGGYRYTYLIDAYHPNVTLSADDFTFDQQKYPGVTVVDLRM